MSAGELAAARGTMSAPLLTAPPGFPQPGESTRYRHLIEAIVTGNLPPPPYVVRWRLPKPDSWSYGLVSGVATPGEDDTWAPAVVFGGYAACLVDQFAGLAMLSVLPDAATFLTASIELDLRTALRPGTVRISGRVIRLAARQAAVEVTLDQDSRTTTRATVMQAVRWQNGRPAMPGAAKRRPG